MLRHAQVPGVAGKPMRAWVSDQVVGCASRGRAGLCFGVLRECVGHVYRRVGKGCACRREVRQAGGEVEGNLDSRRSELRPMDGRGLS